MTGQPAIPTIEQMHAFLNRHYKHDRFEGRNTPEWGLDYSMIVARSRLDYLIEHGVGYVGPYESASGQAFKYTAEDVVKSIP